MRLKRSSVGMYRCSRNSREEVNPYQWSSRLIRAEALLKTACAEKGQKQPKQLEYRWQHCTGEQVKLIRLQALSRLGLQQVHNRYFYRWSTGRVTATSTHPDISKSYDLHTTSTLTIKHRNIWAMIFLGVPFSNCMESDQLKSGEGVNSLKIYANRPKYRHLITRLHINTWQNLTIRWLYLYRITEQVL